MFVWSDKELNDEQSEAVKEQSNVLLIACPGSGKTRTLTYKVAYELSKLTSKKKYIIAITYTNRAADEIKERVDLLGVETEQLWIGTIHSFCLEWILRLYSCYVPALKKGFKVIDAHASDELLSSLCEDYNNQYNLKKWNRISSFDCKYHVNGIPKLKLTNTKAEKKDAVKNILGSYHKHLKDNSQIDFELILYYSLKLLRDNTVICNILSKIFPSIMIDEYQDTKEVQYNIISSIINTNNKPTKLCIIGDPNQSIYQTMGGFPMEKSVIEKICNISLKPLELKKNYRSSAKIINYFDYFKTHKNEIVPAGKHIDYDSTISLNNVVEKDELIDEIGKIIRYNIEELGIPQKEICVIAPQWIHLAGATRRLMLQLPEYSFDGPGMAPFSRDIENFWFRLTRIVLTEPSPNLYIRRLRWSREILDELNNAGVDITSLNAKRFLKICNSIAIDESNGISYLKKFFNAILLQLNIEIENHSTLAEHHKAFFESSEARIKRLEDEGIDYIGDTETFKKVFRQREGITVSTYHGVKGAEFDTVIAFALLHGYIPYKSDRDGVINSKKLLYVIASRARKNLYLIAERKRFSRYGSPPPEYKMTKHLIDYKYDYSP